VLRFGANYTPSTGWFHHWLDFDLDAVRADFDSIAGLGLDHVRVFPLWPVFQPNRGLVRPRAVEQLVAMVDAAAAAGLDVQVDALQGHLSSFDFYPSWVQTWHRRNIFTDPEVVAGQAHYVRTLATALRDRPNFLGMTLGNEVNLLTESNPLSAAEAGAWLDELLAVCDEAAPGQPHVHSEYDAVWYEDGHPFRPEHAARKGAMTTVHSWVFNGTAQRYGPLSPQSVHHAEYLVELAKAWGAPGRPVWLQEIGAAQPEIAAEQAPDFAAQTLANVLTCTELWGVTWWCSHDVDRSLIDFPEREYELGLLTTERKVKPLGETVARLVAEARETPPVPVARTTSLKLTGDRSSWGPGGAFFEEWMDLARDGVRAAISLGGAENSTRAG
jgi:endo-1,4-beta-mannosidase